MDRNTGYCTTNLKEKETGQSFPMVTMYPTTEQEAPTRLGPYNISLAVEAAPLAGNFPLVLISHGSGGSHLVYRQLARTLAASGFIVGMPEHPGNNRNDNSRDGTVENLERRPGHLSTALDWFSEDERFSPLIQTDKIAVIGHSMGAYTALAAAGGVPTAFSRNEPLERSRTLTSIESDPRIKALVLMAPALVWFRPQGSLNAVNCPILLMVGEKDEITPTAYHAKLVLEGVPDPSRVIFREIENAGHFSFLSPFPKIMQHSADGALFKPAQDPPGFCRESFQPILASYILEFFSCLN